MKGTRCYSVHIICSIKKNLKWYDVNMFWFCSTAIFWTGIVCSSFNIQNQRAGSGSLLVFLEKNCVKTKNTRFLSKHLWHFPMTICKLKTSLWFFKFSPPLPSPALLLLLLLQRWQRRRRRKHTRGWLYVDFSLV